MPSHYDVVIATDLRFPGGSSGSTLEEVHAQYKHGWRTGLYHLPSSVLVKNRPFHFGLCHAMLDGECQLANLDTEPIHTDILIVRHPSVIPLHDAPLPDIRPTAIVLVVNHPPANAKGRIDYILPYARRRLRNAYGVDPVVHPIGPLVREELNRYYGPEANLRPLDWSNIFDVERFDVRRTPPKHRIRIGRHSRPGREKWPDTPEAILAAYPEDEDIDVHILGGSEAPETILTRRPNNWTVHQFGAMAAEDFLRTIDVFVYYHHPQWTEAFGRVIAEAMASSLPAILPPHFRPLFGEAAIYAEPHEVRSKIDHLLFEPDEYMRWSQVAREYVRRNFSHATHMNRLVHLRNSTSISEVAEA